MSIRFRHLLRCFGRTATGGATIEFVILFMPIVWFGMALGEVGTLVARSTMLERGVVIAVRDLRIGALVNPTHDSLKASICEHAFLLRGCEEVILLELLPLEDLASGLPDEVQCVDRTEEIQPTINFNPGARSQIMLVRACIVVDPLFPGTGIGALLPKEASGGYAIVSESAFVNEPK